MREHELLDGPFEDAEVNLKLPKLAEVSFFKKKQTKKMPGKSCLKKFEKANFG